MSERWVCLHGHFYQPPRENPWLERIERQPSAKPFHDWNERIDHESYAPNAFSRALDGDGRIARIMNNYGWMSFNFGPTLLAWMEEHAPATYQAVLDADRESRERFSGHGSAIAQAYSHMILPLASHRDKATQIEWGLRDFESRFGRSPEGMWLPETGVDLESLDLMARAGIRYTILAPDQAAATRNPENSNWVDVRGGRVDTTRPYRVELPSGKEFAVFFYDGPLSRAVAFEQVLADGGAFAKRLLAGGASGTRPDGLIHIATDGETYGHHHRHGEMALSVALLRIREREGARLTNYGEYLARFPPDREARIEENTAWSCAHGVERWNSDCGCATGSNPEWRQAWRAPLRSALDWLRDCLASRFEEAAEGLLVDPWGARDRYIEVILDRSRENVDRFLSQELAEEGERTDADRVRALKLLELQRHAQLMYTSCGWFFDDLAGIETLQVLKYAARALQLGEIVGTADLEEEFLARLDKARSNLPGNPSGRKLYLEEIHPSRVDLAQVAAHHSVAALFPDPASAAGEVPSESDAKLVYCYRVTAEDGRQLSSGRARLSLGKLRVESTIVLTSATLSYAVLHLGDHNVVGGVRNAQDPEAYQKLMAELSGEFEAANFPEVIRRLDREFHAGTYSLRSLFRDEQERILRRILDSSLSDAEVVLGRLYESRSALMRFLGELNVPQPAPFRTAGEFVVNTRLNRALKRVPPELDTAERLVREAKATRLELDRERIALVAGRTLQRLLESLAEEPEGPGRLEEAHRMALFLGSLPFDVDLWWPQNSYFQLFKKLHSGFAERAEEGDDRAREWLTLFREVGETVGIAVPPEAS